MIRDLAQAVAADLRARKYPYPVTVGPERVGHDSFAASVVFRRDRSVAEQIGPPMAATRPRATSAGAEAPFTRQLAGAFTVYARSSLPGAAAADHEEECDRVVDGVLTAMYRVLAARRLPLTIVEARVLTRDQLRAEAEDGSTGADDRSGARAADWPGCAQRVRFVVRVLVRDVTYQGASPATGTIYQFAEPTVTAGIGE